MPRRRSPDPRSGRVTPPAVLAFSEAYTGFCSMAWRPGDQAIWLQTTTSTSSNMFSCSALIQA
ncbi:MAG: hypothetical protein DIU84_00485 [Bacillota bacterium]|nr:MAG: hypothetical protein DIU84_00485 [Bacillota bacterium]